MVDNGGWWWMMVDDGGWWWMMVGDVECDAENDELSWKQLKMGETSERELVETIWTLFGCFWKKTSFDCSILFQPLMAWCGNPLRWAPACCVASKVGYAAAMYCWSALRRCQKAQVGCNTFFTRTHIPQKRGKTQRTWPSEKIKTLSQKSLNKNWLFFNKRCGGILFSNKPISGQQKKAGHSKRRCWCRAPRLRHNRQRREPTPGAMVWKGRKW